MARPDAYGPFVDLLVRDIASSRRDDPAFRSSGTSILTPVIHGVGRWRLGDGNNQESSSEALAAWTAIVLLGEIRATAHCATPASISMRASSRPSRPYWFDVDRKNFPADYPHPSCRRSGRKGATQPTSRRARALYGINWLHFTVDRCTSPYPDYASRAYDALVAARDGTTGRCVSLS